MEDNYTRDDVPPDPKAWRTLTDSQRFVLIKDIRVKHPRLNSLIDALNNCAQSADATASRMPSCLAVVGLPAVGKTTLVENWIQCATAQHVALGKGLTIPYICICLPTQVTGKGILAACPAALGDPAHLKEVSWNQMQRLRPLIRILKVRFLVIDNLQYIVNRETPRPTAVRITLLRSKWVTCSLYVSVTPVSERTIPREACCCVHLISISIRSHMSLRRKPPKGNIRRVVSIDQNLRGTFTNKAGYIVQFESFSERILTLLFERDLSILDYRSQPGTFAFTDQNKKPRKYTPDFIVLRQNSIVEIHEVTRTERQRNQCIQEREAAARRICQEKGWEYIVHTEQTLPQRTEVTNLMALLPYRLEKYTHEDITIAVQKHLTHSTKSSLHGCMKDTAHQLDLPEAIVFSALCHMIWKDEVSTDLQILLIADCMFTSRATIWLPNKEEKK